MVKRYIQTKLASRKTLSAKHWKYERVAKIPIMHRVPALSNDVQKRVYPRNIANAPKIFGSANHSYPLANI